jgi:flagellar biosynthesis/type III secretory pathway protein FliH
MTTAERLRAEGHAQGHAQGHAEGRAQGRAELLRDQLTAKFGPLPTAILHAIKAADPDKLHDWAMRLITAEQLEDIFTD